MNPGAGERYTTGTYLPIEESNFITFPKARLISKYGSLLPPARKLHAAQLSILFLKKE